MGRPRKQPRRIVTFNLNLPLAEAIDSLPVKNRSEWMNANLPALLKPNEALEQVDNETLFLQADAQGIMDTFSDTRLLIVLLSREGIAVTSNNLSLARQALSRTSGIVEWD